MRTLADGMGNWAKRWVKEKGSPIQRVVITNVKKVSRGREIEDIIRITPRSS